MIIYFTVFLSCFVSTLCKTFMTVVTLNWHKMLTVNQMYVKDCCFNFLKGLGFFFCQKHLKAKKEKLWFLFSVTKWCKCANNQKNYKGKNLSMSKKRKRTAGYFRGFLIIFFCDKSQSLHVTLEAIENRKRNKTYIYKRLGFCRKIYGK